MRTEEVDRDVLRHNRKQSGEIRSEMHKRWNYEGETPDGFPDWVRNVSNEATVALGMQLILDGMNGANTERAAQWLAETFLSEHRTLQQSTVRMLQLALAHIEQETREGQNTDLRNEQAIEQIRHWVRAKREYLPLI